MKRILLALLLAFVFSGALFPLSQASAESAAQVDEVRQLLEQYHLSKPTDEQLNQEAINGMVESLKDPYTEYFDENEWKSFSNALDQTFTGVGIVMTSENGIVYVEDTFPGSPADTAGVLPGDAIVSADGESVKGLSVVQLQLKLRGAEGSTLTLGVSRDGKPLKFKVERRSIVIPSATSRPLGDGVGYLSLTAFSSDAGTAFAKQLAELEKQNIGSLIVDLRGNGGGYVTAAQQIAGMFLKDGVLAHLKDRDGKDEPLAVKGTPRTYPVTVLVDGGSASASELLAGALQDYGAAKLVGTTTFGKGVVQSLVPVSSGGMLKVTVEEYFTPNGRKVDKVGLTPDTVVDGSSAEQLIAAFRQSGGHTLAVAAGKGTVTVNGVRSAQPEAVLARGGVSYVNLRLAAAVANAKVGFDAKTRTITLTKGTVVHKLQLGDNRLVVKNGRSLLDDRLIGVWFPEVVASAATGTYTLSVQ